MTAETNAAALAELETAFELGLNAATNRQPERIDIAIERFRAAAALLRAGAAKVPGTWTDQWAASRRQARKAVESHRDGTLDALTESRIIMSINAAFEALWQHTIHSATPPAPDAGVAGCGWTACPHGAECVHAQKGAQ